MKKRDKGLEIPLFIVRKSKNYYQNSVTGKYIPTNKIDEYVNRLRDTANKYKEDKTIHNYWWNNL